MKNNEQDGGWDRRLLGCESMLAAVLLRLGNSVHSRHVDALP